MNDSPVLADAGSLEMVHPLSASQLVENVCLLVLAVRRQEERDGFTDYLCRAITVDAFCAGIPRQDGAVRIFAGQLRLQTIRRWRLNVLRRVLPQVKPRADQSLSRFVNNTLNADDIIVLEHDPPVALAVVQGSLNGKLKFHPSAVGSSGGILEEGGKDVGPLGNQPSKIVPVTFDSHLNATRLNVLRQIYEL